MTKLHRTLALLACAWMSSSALATHPSPPPVPGPGPCFGPSDDGYDANGWICDITAKVEQVVPAAASAPGSAALSSPTQTNYVKYRVTLSHYTLRREAFNQVKFVADTVVSAGTAGPAKFFAASAPIVANSGNAAILVPPNGNSCVISGAALNHIECTFDFDPSKQGFDYPPTGTISSLLQPTITFELTVQSPTGTTLGTLKVNSITRYSESGGSSEPESYGVSTLTNLTVPDPTVVDTYVPTAGTVTTGAQSGAATCVEGNKWVTIVKVPEAASVSVNLNPDGTLPTGTTFFSKVGIPNQLFGVGTKWYDHDAVNKLLVVKLRRDKCTIGSGNATAKDALLILKEKIYYRPDHVVYWPGTSILKNPPPGLGPDPVYLPLNLCLVTGGPYPGEPCIVFAQVYTKFNLPNVPNADSLYRGDFEWVIFANENGRYTN